MSELGFPGQTASTNYYEIAGYLRKVRAEILKEVYDSVELSISHGDDPIVITLKLISWE
ncbi:MAG: hypothetical protein LC778_10370 [Acidobacteria bacterium]|nr:hypothetical protein [Acidobacteriota bacterium]